MEKKQWVQYKNDPQGKRWEVIADFNTGWRVRNPQDEKDWFLLAKKEYHLCEPPEVWRDVTEECVVIGGVILSHQGADVNAADGYRLCKVRVYPYRQPTEITTWAFIVEQKVSQ